MNMKPTSTAPAKTALCLATAAFTLVTVNAAVYNVSSDGKPMTLTAALEVAGAGDTISLGDGINREPIVTMNAGEDGNPLVIEGGRGAVINYFSGDRSLMWSQKVVDIRHSWITLRGFTVDGWLDDEDREESFVDKCIWVEGKDKPKQDSYRGSKVKTSLIGTVVEDMRIQNCGMECIRMRNWVTNSVIKDNDFETCGIYDFRFQFDGKIGEAIYIGTSSNQNKKLKKKLKDAKMLKKKMMGEATGSGKDKKKVKKKIKKLSTKTKSMKLEGHSGGSSWRIHDSGGESSDSCSSQSSDSEWEGSSCSSSDGSYDSGSDGGGSD